MKNILELLFFLLFSSGISFAATENSCADCHGDAQKMAAFGKSHFTISLKDVEIQTGMPASCAECHLGNPRAEVKEEAHQGLLTLRVITNDWRSLVRSEMEPDELKDWAYLEPRGKDRATQLGPKRFEEDNFWDNRDFRAVIWHDKNPETFAYNPSIGMKTCGKCHAEIVAGFAKTPMGGAHGAHVQSQYIFWTGETGPQSCGLWQGDLTQPGQEAFTEHNLSIFNNHTTMAIPRKTAYDLQRNCNRCHVGCLDCHYTPRKRLASDPKAGPHTFTEVPEPLSCYGGGRAFLCHAGPLDRRRGDGYLRAEFTQATAAGKKILQATPDIHQTKGLSCVACHKSNPASGQHADLQRQVDCAPCHGEVVNSHQKGLHRHVACAACHTALIGGYAFNFWTVGGPAGQEGPLKRIDDYFTGANPPLIIKNPKDIWIPVHLVPHTSGNIKAEEVHLSRKLLFRNRPDAGIERRYLSGDSFAITGIVEHLDEKDHDTMVWMNLDLIAHGLSKARPCESCHASPTQRIQTTFTGGSYKNLRDGSYTIIADENSLRVTDFSGPNGTPPPSALEPLRDKWILPGNFAMPTLQDKTLYEKLMKESQAGAFTH